MIQTTSGTFVVYFSAALKGTAGNPLASAGTGLCGPGTADVTLSQTPGQGRIFVNGWVQESGGVISTTPFGTGTPQENVNAARVMYAALLKFGPDGYSPVIGEYLGQ